MNGRENGAASSGSLGPWVERQRFSALSGGRRGGQLDRLNITSHGYLHCSAYRVAIRACRKRETERERERESSAWRVASCRCIASEYNVVLDVPAVRSAANYRSEYTRVLDAKRGTNPTTVETWLTPFLYTIQNSPYDALGLQWWIRLLFFAKMNFYTTT